MKITAQQVVISETELKVIEIWQLFKQLQTVADNREYCNLELSDSGSGHIRHYLSDTLCFPDGSDIVSWDDFDHGIEVLTNYLKFMETYDD